MENNGFSLETISEAKLFGEKKWENFIWKFISKFIGNAIKTVCSYAGCLTHNRLSSSKFLHQDNLSIYCGPNLASLNRTITTNLKCLGLLCRKLAGSLKRTRDGLWWSPQTRDITLLVMVWWENNNYIGVSTNGINYWLYLERLSWTSCLEQPGISALERFWFKRRSLHEPKQIHKLL